MNIKNPKINFSNSFEIIPTQLLTYPMDAQATSITIPTATKPNLITTTKTKLSSPPKEDLHLLTPYSASYDSIPNALITTSPFIYDSDSDSYDDDLIDSIPLIRGGRGGRGN
eukprot:221323_1